ncbi:hypothetical protein Tco_1509250 [Tanacetum coccineum]
MQQMWITLKLANSKEVFRFMVDEVEVTFSLLELRTILRLPLATAKNNVEFVEPLELSVMLEFLDIISHTTQIHLTGQFYTKNLPQPWQTLVKILIRCINTRETNIDQPPFHMMQMFYYIVNNVHVDYAALIWEGLHYSLMHPSTSVPYSRFIKLILDSILTTYPDIPKRTNELHHYVANDEMVQSIFNFGKKKIREDPDTRIDPGNYKESLEAKKVAKYISVDEEVEVETAKAALIRRKGKGSLEIRDTPLATPTRSPRTESLSLDKEKL